MSRYLIIILTAFVISCEYGLSQDQNPYEDLRNNIELRGQARITIPYQGRNHLNELSKYVSVSALREEGVEVVITAHSIDWLISSGNKFELIEPPDAKSLKSAGSIEEAMEWDSYPTYTQYVAIMQQFEANYPLLCNLDTIGTSINGKLVLVLKISDNAGEDEDEPETFYTSTMHGDETGGYILMLRLADYLLENYNSNNRVKNIVDNMELWINPLANPDGTYNSGDMIASPVRQNANGYDLNRNFPDPITPNTVKQKETLDMMSFLRERRFTLSANFHSGVEVVNYPWDRWSRTHPDDIWFTKISRKYADTVHQHSPATYMDFKDNGITNGYDWYFIAGGRQDYVTWELQGREVTIELDNNYVTPAASLNTLWEYNWRSLLGYLENVLYGIHGVVIDKVTRKPVYAKIFIGLHDADSSHVYSDSLSGKFIRMLEPGSWDLRISAEGYIDTEVKAVQIFDGQPTEIIVELVPELNPVDTITVIEPLVYPNPSSTYIKAVLPPSLSGLTAKVTIIDSSGRKVYEWTESVVEDIPLFIRTGGFSPGYYTLMITVPGSTVSTATGFVVSR